MTDNALIQNDLYMPDKFQVAGQTPHRPAVWADVPDDQWNDWRWQLANRITTVEQLREVIPLSEEEGSIIEQSLNKLRMAITPYYASLIDVEDPQCPIRMRSIPTMEETHILEEDMVDPLHEDIDSPVPGLTHRYPDRVLMLLTDQCSMYCRHCTRRRFAGETDRPQKRSVFDDMVQYVKENRGVRDIVLSGGDPLTMGNERLEYVIAKLAEIPHVEIIRLGTAIPVVMPMRVTDDLVTMLKKYQPIWVNTHFNHPKEITPESKAALAKLVDGGMVVSNQNVLLRGVNDCPYIIKELFQRLLQARVNPYKMYQCDLSRGIGHFRTSIACGLGIMEHLIGHTSGMALPQYVVDLPGGGGKVPVDPRYLITQSGKVAIFRNYEGKLFKYTEPADTSFKGCPQHCTICTDRKARGLDTPNVGLAKLMDTEDIVL